MFIWSLINLKEPVLNFPSPTQVSRIRPLPRPNELRERYYLKNPMLLLSSYQLLVNTDNLDRKVINVYCFVALSPIKWYKQWENYRWVLIRSILVMLIITPSTLENKMCTVNQRVYWTIQRYWCWNVFFSNIEMWRKCQN